ncbi:MAG: glucose-6-phosphate dehydrogenase [Candidatus Saccharimonadales bacterium]
MAGRLQPTTLVVFGISGDLSHRYLLPALAEIKKAALLPADFKILGISRRQISLDEALGESAEELSSLAEVLTMDLSQKTDYDKLHRKIKGLGKERQTIFYLAVPPSGVPSIIRQLGAAGLNGPHIKLLLEKPFGVDLESAKALIKETNQYFKESQVYRIDHYLAKETAQNIAVFLGSNALFRHVWDSEFIEYIEITAAEEIGIEDRGQFYEQTGALRDFVQSHLLQLAALTLMKPCPHDFDFADLPERRLEALRQLQIRPGELDTHVVRAQYDGYPEEVANPGSQTETFVALQLESTDPRWQGMPIYLATGKKLDQKLTQIRVNFKKDDQSEANMLILRLQPKEGIEVELWVKQPGFDRQLQKKTLSFYYEQAFGEKLPEAYEKVIVDAIRGRQSLFASSSEIIESWRILQPVLDYWSMASASPKMYRPGSTVQGILQNT